MKVCVSTSNFALPAPRFATFVALPQAFKTGDPSGLRATLASSPSLVNYRRKLGDGTTALMAAAFHGDTDAVRYLLSLGAKASLVDATGRSAAVYAGMGAHHKCFAELQRIADEEARAARLLGEDRDDFVYDLYYFEPPASRSSMERGGAGLPDVQAGGTASMIPTVSGPTTKKVRSAGRDRPNVLISACMGCTLLLRARSWYVSAGASSCHGSLLKKLIRTVKSIHTGAHSVQPCACCCP